MIILFLFVIVNYFSLSYLIDCPGKRFGTNCTELCTNCSIGCDIAGSCINGTCVTGFYATGCRETNILNSPPLLAANNCMVTVNSSIYNSTNSNINPTTYYAVFGPWQSSYNQDYLTWPNKSIMTCGQTCLVNINIINGNFSFAVYFDFYNINYGELFQSLVSLAVTATCNSVSNIPTTSIPPPTTPSQPTTTLPPQPTTIPTTTTTTPVTNPSNSVTNLISSNTSSYGFTINWSPPTNLINFRYYKITVQPNDSGNSPIITTSLNQIISNLRPGNIYNITVTTIYAVASADTTITVCTSPANDVLVDSASISNIDRKSITALFPSDRTNYTCSRNVYIIAYSQTVVSNRKKRSVSNVSPITVGITVAYSGTQSTSPITIGNLSSATNYTIYAVIYTNVVGNITYYFSTTYAQTNGPTDGAIVGIVLGILLLLLLVAVILFLLFWFRKRKENSHTNLYHSDYDNNLKEIVDDNKPRSFAYWSEISDKMQPRQLVLDPNDWTEDLEVMRKMQFNRKRYAPTGIRFIDEYTSLPTNESYPCTDAEINYTKNKRQDILPYNHNRVRLSVTTSTESDYINASFIDGYVRKKAYIAAQSPFDQETSNDFWKMIYQFNVGQIVMLTDVEYANITTSIIYWPQMNSRKKEILYGNISVKIISECKFACYDIREFELNDITYEVQSQLVTQYQFHGWPHNDIPENSIAFLAFYQEIKIAANISNGPLLIHCGSGISQTAIYIAFDILNQRVIHENEVNVFRVVAEIRRARSKMINNVKQYMFIYDLLFESLLCGQFMATTNVKKVLKLLQNINPESKINYLYEQFLLLQSYHTVTNCQCNTSKEISFVDSINLSQNLGIITSPVSNSTDINAFWNTIFNEEINVIIDLRTTNDKPYYIRDNLLTFDISINNVIEKKKSFRKFEIILRDLSNKTTANISIYQLGTNWINNNDIYSAPAHAEVTLWVDIMDDLIRNHENSRILALCSDGYNKSGLFLTCYNVALKMYNSKYVMVYNVVKSMKFYRYELVTSYAQFQFIYTFLKKWIDIKMSNDLEIFDSFPGLLTDGHIKESLFTHEQTPVIRPDEKEKYAPSIYSFNTIEKNDYSMQNAETQGFIHYKIGLINEYKI